MRNELVVSYFKDGLMMIGTYKESLLRKEVEELVETAKWHRCMLDLSGKWLPDKYSGLEFESAYMKNINTRNSTAFDKCKFNRVDLSYAWMFGNSFKGSLFTDVIIDHANLSHSDLSGARFFGVSFDKTNMFGIRRDKQTEFVHCNVGRAVHLD